MNLINILIIGSAVVLVLLLWIIVGVRHLKHLNTAFSKQWEEVSAGLRKRHDLAPILVEILRMYDRSKEPVIGKLIEVRQKASREYGAGAQKIEYEYDFSKGVDEILRFSGELPEFAKDSNYLELRTEFDYLGREIEEKSKEYNDAVRLYNRHRRGIFLRPLAAAFRYKRADIFEVEV